MKIEVHQHRANKNAILVHAGVPPIWDKLALFEQTLAVEKQLQSSQAGNFINAAYGNLPRTWKANLSAMEKCRYTINACMRMRLCQVDGLRSLLALPGICRTCRL